MTDVFTPEKRSAVMRRVPKQNRDYWLGKVGRNTARDEASRTALEAAGWRVETIWECDLRDEAALNERLKGLLL